MKVCIVGGAGSNGARNLANVIEAQHEGARCLSIRVNSPRHRPETRGNADTTYLRWRSADPGDRDVMREAVAYARRVLNPFTEDASDKLAFFSEAHRFDQASREGSGHTPIQAPAYSILSRHIDRTRLVGHVPIRQMLTEGMSRVVFRRTARGSGGEGIYITRKDVMRDEVLSRGWRELDNQALDAEVRTALAQTAIQGVQFATEYFPKAVEFRIHVYRGMVFAVQRKTFRTQNGGPSDEQRLVRNHSNGWYFNVNMAGGPDGPSERVLRAAINACHAAGVHIGAVDVGVMNNGDYCVFEVNTSPGISDCRIATAYSYVVGLASQQNDNGMVPNPVPTTEERLNMWRALLADQSVPVRGNLYRRYAEFIDRNLHLAAEIMGTEDVTAD